MKFTIDTDDLQSSGGIAESLYLLSVYFGDRITEDTITKVHEKSQIFVDEFTDGKPTSLHLTPNGIEDVEKILMTKTINTLTDTGEDRYIVLARNLIALYPKGRKPGTNTPWRDSEVMIATRLKTLVKKYNVEFTDEEAISATRAYVKANNYGSNKEMRVLKYFISKNVKTGEDIEKISDFMAWIDMVREGNIQVDTVADNASDDWTLNMV